MINFIDPHKENYKEILDSFISPIVKHLQSDKYKISSESDKDCLNIHFFLEKEYLHWVGMNGKNIFMSHGIADKNWRNYNSVKRFDYVIVSGKAWEKKLVNQGMDVNKIFIGGYSKLDPLFNKKITKEKSDKKVILWCPTHNFTSELYRGLSTYPDFIQYINYIPHEDFIFRISEHPANRLAKNTTSDELIKADIIIADSGSTIYEAWALGKPVIFPDWIVKELISRVYKDAFEEEVFLNNIGYHAKDITELVKLLYEITAIDENAINFMERILPSYLRGNSGLTIAKFLEQKDGEL